MRPVATAVTALALLPAFVVVAESQAPDTLTVAGIVVERGSAAPIPDALVTLAATVSAETVDTQLVRRRTTDVDGRFLFTALLPGRYEVRVTRIGYRVLSAPIDVSAGPPIELTAEMVPSAVNLDPVLVTAPSAPSAGLGITGGRETRVGFTIDREQIEASRDNRVSDLLRTVPGVRVERPTSFGELDVHMRNGCMPSLFLDGVQTASIATLDATIRPVDLDAIQVYRGPETPVIYRRRDGCGAILLWTRGRDLREGRGSFWGRLLVGATFFGVVLLILR